MGWLSKFRKWLHQHDGQLIEKSYKYPTTSRPNPFLDRLDPAKEKKPCLVNKIRLPKPGKNERNPFLTDDGELKPGLAPPIQPNQDSQIYRK